MKRMIMKRSKSLTDEQFFCSNAVQLHYEKIVASICKRYGREKLSVIIQKTGDYVARTNGRTIYVNFGTDWIANQKNRIDKYYIIMGLILHECGHVLYTDFNILAKALNVLFYPPVDMTREVKEILSDKMKVLQMKQLYKTFSNCIEDGYIERRIIKNSPGYGECLIKVRQLHLAVLKEVTVSEPVTFLTEEQAEADAKAQNIAELMNNILCFAKFEIDLSKKEQDSYAWFFLIKKLIKKAVKTCEPQARQKLINEIFVKITEYINENLPEKNSDEVLKQVIAQMPDEYEDNTEHTGSIEQPIAESKADEPDFDKEDNSEEESEPEQPIAESKADEPDFDKEDNSEEESEPDLSKLETDVAEEIVADEIHNAIEKKMKKIADRMVKDRWDKYPSAHRYIQPDARAEREYYNHHKELDRISRRVVKNLDKVIEERLKGDKLTGLYSGKMIDTTHLYRKDGKIMANKIMPEDAPDMEICTLVDCSGSMGCRGSNGKTRIYQARDCAYITYKFCEQMGIPCSIYGHSTTHDNRRVQMTCVAHSENIDKNDAKRIFMLSEDWDNRDGWAVNFCCEALNESKAKKKILFVISDGLPAASGYDFRIGARDCKEVVAKYKKKGINIIVAGIDDCAADIKDVYLQGVPKKEAATYLDFTDMNKLPKAFAQIIRKEIM